MLSSGGSRSAPVPRVMFLARAERYSECSRSYSEYSQAYSEYSQAYFEYSHRRTLGTHTGVLLVPVPCVMFLARATEYCGYSHSTVGAHTRCSGYSHALWVLTRRTLRTHEGNHTRCFRSIGLGSPRQYSHTVCSEYSQLGDGAEDRPRLWVVTRGILWVLTRGILWVLT
jgi:hypothetical protein